jgi:hypothetical protein
MILSAYQPYFAPHPGFFAKAARSDVFVLLDAVQFPRGTTWLTRNRFKNDQGVLWMTIPVWKKGLGLQRISEVRICHEQRWAGKHLESLKTAYAKAPFFEDHLPFLERLFGKGHERLVGFNMELLRHVMEHLGIATRVVLLSELGIDRKEPQLSVEICKQLGASTFLAQAGAKKYLDAGVFRREGISLEFFSPRPLVYPQLWGEFLFNLSALDLLFTCGPKAGRILHARS